MVRSRSLWAISAFTFAALVGAQDYSYPSLNLTQDACSDYPTGYPTEVTVTETEIETETETKTKTETETETETEIKTKTETETETDTETETCTVTYVYSYLGFTAIANYSVGYQRRSCMC